MAFIEFNMRRCSLELYDYNPTIGLGWGSGRAGFWKRAEGLGYCYETYLRAPDDFKVLYQTNINSAVLEVTCNNQGNQFRDGVAYLCEQNKTTFDLLNDPPTFAEFSGESWNMILDTTPIKNKGIYQFSASGLTALVQSWVDGSKNFRDGMILGIDFQALDWWLSIDSAVLKIDYSMPSGCEVPMGMLNPRANGTIGKKLLG